MGHIGWRDLQVTLFFTDCVEWSEFLEPPLEFVIAWSEKTRGSDFDRQWHLAVRVASVRYGAHWLGPSAQRTFSLRFEFSFHLVFQSGATG